MRIPYYHVDVFTNGLFRGNPAGVCLLPSDWLPTDVMQQIAFENNLSETAFVVRHGDGFGLRWFTPTTEMDLCGHATVAPAHVLFEEKGLTADTITFDTKSGAVSVERGDGRLVLDFPSRPPEPCDMPVDVVETLGARPSESWRSRDLLFVFDREDDVRALAPDFARVRGWGCHAVIVTAPGDAVDFVSRFFAPLVGVDEDPVTGSAHTTLIPYWAKRLGKTDLHARQISARGGELFCRDAGERVEIGGQAIIYARGEIDLGD